MITHCDGCRKPISEVGYAKNVGGGSGRRRKMLCKGCRRDFRERLRLEARA